jgi:hypothetical protein
MVDVEQLLLDAPSDQQSGGEIEIASLLEGFDIADSRELALWKDRMQRLWKCGMLAHPIFRSTIWHILAFQIILSPNGPGFLDRTCSAMKRNAPSFRVEPFCGQLLPR